MPLKLNVGISKKVGLPDYGSLGATCHVEVELEPSLLQHDLESLQRHIRHAYDACRRAVEDELRHARGETNGHAPMQSNGDYANGRIANGQANGNGAVGNGYDYGYENGSGQSAPSQTARRMATQSQVRAIRAIAGRHKLDLAELLGHRFGIARLEDLTLLDASSLIDELKGQTNGHGNGNGAAR